MLEVPLWPGAAEALQHPVHRAMSPQEVAASYDRIADRWTDPGFDRRNGIAAHERALRFAPEPGPALDVGCGSSGRFIDLLLEQGYRVEGLDLSAEMLRLARWRHPQVTFHHADVSTWAIPGGYRFISAWDCLWHLPLARQLPVLLQLGSALAPEGVLIFSAGGGEEPDERYDSAMGVPMYHATPGIPRIVGTLHDAGCRLRHLEYDQYPAAHVFFIAQRI